jgi:L-threonylcarbamoyladenylate synthase
MMNGTLLDHYAELLRAGEVVAFPTETVYGLGADAWNPEAVLKVFSLKGRPADNPLIVHISSLYMLEDFTDEIPGTARKLIEVFWPGPLTMIFKKKEKVLDLITGGLDTVAVRMPDHPLALSLISHSGPVVAPSANKSGKPSPTKPEHVLHDFGSDFPVVDGGECRIGLESTVIDITAEPIQIYRPGFVNKEHLEDVLHMPVSVYKKKSDDIKPRSPGMKYTHYSPDAIVRWLNGNDNFSEQDAIYLLHSKEIEKEGKHIIHYRNRYDILAKELYDRFRQADLEGISEIIIEPFPMEVIEQHPLLPALLNRIQKAVGEVV